MRFDSPMDTFRIWNCTLKNMRLAIEAATGFDGSTGLPVRVVTVKQKKNRGE